MKRNPALCLHDILEAIQLIEASTAGVSKEVFESNRDLQDATIRRIEIIGEAAKGVPPALRAKHPQLPWRSISGTRDVLIHNYSGVVMGTVWEVLKNDLPSLKSGVQKILKGLEDEKLNESGKPAKGGKQK